MPIPFVFIAIGAITGLFGVGKSVKAGVDTHTAKKVTNEANSILEAAKKRMNKARKKSGERLEELGRCKINILDSSMNDFVRLFEQIKNIDFKESDGILEVNKLKLDKQALKELKEMSGFASSVIGGVAGGALGGALTAYGAYSAAGVFAAASTTTKIATLVGIAKTNATLAFFGGGSLATGGLGMAGGTAVLGGLIAGPALAIMGLIVGAKASKAKDEAYSNLALAQKNAKEIDLAVTLCDAISSRCNMFCSLLNDLDVRFKPILAAMNDTIQIYGTDYSTYPLENKKTIAAAASLAVSIKTVLDTPLLTKDGQLTSESAKLLKEMKSDKPKTQRKTGVKKTKAVKKSLHDIVMQNTYERYRDEEDSDSYSSVFNLHGRVKWSALIKNVNASFGIELDEESAKLVVDGFGENEHVEMWRLEYQVSQLIYLYQMGGIVQSCSNVDVLNSMIINVDDVDWERLIGKIKEFYGKDMAKWQLTSGKNSNGEIAPNSIFEAIITKVSSDDSLGEKTLLHYDVFEKAIQ